MATSPTVVRGVLHMNNIMHTAIIRVMVTRVVTTE
jgi:hypothetical protein